jgi:hypothetical protein
VQLSRARHDTRLFAVVGPEPYGAGELDLPDRDQPDAYLQLAQALDRAGGQTLAIDTSNNPDLQRLSTAELRASGTGCAASSTGLPATALGSWPTLPPTVSKRWKPWPPTSCPPIARPGACFAG